MRKKDALLEDTKRCLVDPVFNVVRNFSKEKSEDYYKLHADEWARWIIIWNPAGKVERIELPYSDLSEMSAKSKEADTLINNMSKLDYIKWLHWVLEWNAIVIKWQRLKTFDEWLEDGLRDALESAIEWPEEWARIMLRNEWHTGWYSNAAIHIYAEWKIDIDTLDRLGEWEMPNSIKDVNLDEALEKAKEDLEKGDSNVTVLQCKVK